MVEPYEPENPSAFVSADPLSDPSHNEITMCGTRSNGNPVTAFEKLMCVKKPPDMCGNETCMENPAYMGMDPEPALRENKIHLLVYKTTVMIKLNGKILSVDPTRMGLSRMTGEDGACIDPIHNLVK